MKKLITLIVTLVMIFSIIGCTNDKEKTESYFNGVVSQLDGDSITVTPIENEKVNSSETIINAKAVAINSEVVSKDGVPKLKVGDKIRIVYNESSIKENPLKIEIVFAIYLLDEKGL